MKTHFIAILAAACIILTACSHDASMRLDNQNDTLNWAIGVQTAQGLKGLSQMGFAIDKEIILAAMQSTLDGKETRLDDQQYAAAIDQLNIIIAAGKRQAQEEVVKKASEGEAEFFDKLPKDNPAVKKSDKGFYYEVLQAGNGRQCKEGLVAVFDYRSFTLDGKPYDATYGNRDAIVHVVGKPMFEGLIDGMCLMRAGAKYRFYFPHETCVGANPESPFSPMIYEIELHEVRDL